MVNFDSQNPTSATIWPSNLAEAVNNTLLVVVLDSRSTIQGEN